FDIEKGEAVIFSAGLEVAKPETREQSFAKELSRRIPRNNFENCLRNSAGQFVYRRNGETRVIAGFPWFGWWGRDTFVSLPGLTLTQGDTATFLEAIDTMVLDLEGPLFPNLGSGAQKNRHSIDAPLWFFWALQQYVLMTGDAKTVKERYLDKFKAIIDGFIQGTAFNIKVQEDGLLSGGMEGMALTWMDVITPDGPVTPRTGCPVEVNALWYNALCFYCSLKPDEALADLSERLKSSFVENFWDEEKGYLADVAQGSKKDWSIRPNMLIAVSLPYSPLEETQDRKSV